MQCPALQSNVRVVIVRAKLKLCTIYQDESNARSHQDLHEVGTVTNRSDQQQVHQVTEKEEQDSGRNEANIRIDVEFLKQEPGDVHPNHEKSAVGKVDDAHHPEDQCQTHANQRVECAVQQAVTASLEEV